MNHPCLLYQGHHYDKMTNSGGGCLKTQNTGVTSHHDDGNAAVGTYYGDHSISVDSHQYAGSIDIFSSASSQGSSSQWDSSSSFSSSPAVAPAVYYATAAASPLLYHQNPSPQEETTVWGNSLENQQQYAGYIDPYHVAGNFHMLQNIPLSPMSMQSLEENFDHLSLLSPKSVNTVMYYVNDVLLTTEEYMNHQYHSQQPYHRQQLYPNYELLCNDVVENIQQQQQVNRDLHRDGATSYCHSNNKQQQQVIPSIGNNNHNNGDNTLTTTKAKSKLHHHDHHQSGVSSMGDRYNNNNNKQQPQQKKKKSPSRKKRITLDQVTCHRCTKVFSRPYNLKSHLKTHTKDRPYLCLIPDCGWTFARPHDLRRHYNSLHAGIKPFVCQCGKKFARSDAFKRHVQQAASSCF